MDNIKQIICSARWKKGTMPLLSMIISLLLFLALADTSSARTQNVTFTLSWEDNSNNEDGFVLQRREGRQGSQFVDVATVGAGVVSAEDTITESVGNVTYCYRVLAYNGAGRSGSSNEVCKTTPAIGPVTIFVNCSTASLQTALLSVFPGDTLSVSGTCDENVRVPNDVATIFLDGGGTAVINGVDSSQPAIDARGKALLIQGFTITGGSSGITVQRESKALINNNVIQNTGGSGVVVSQLGFAVLINNTIQGNAGDGVAVEDRAAARIGFNNDTETLASPNTIRGNGGNGVTVTGSSSARVVGNVINTNGRYGVRVTGLSQADTAGNMIDNNGGAGIFVGQNSVVNLGENTGTTIFDLPNSTNDNNIGVGVECAGGGIAEGRLGTLAGDLGLTSFPAGSGCINDLM